MKKIMIFVIVLLCINTVIVFGTEPNNTANQEILDEVRETLLYKVSTNNLYSKWGWSQKDVVTQYLANNSGFKKELNVNSDLDAATIDNIEYGNIIGVCAIDFKKLDQYIVDNTLQENLEKVIRILDEYYIEMKCNDVTLSYMNINEDERISHFIEPGIFKSEYIKNILPKELYVEPIIYLIEDNDYIKGIYVNSKDNNGIITYENFSDSINNEQFTMNNTIEILNKADEEYIIDNPRIDYELLEQQKLQEIQQLIEEGKQRDIVLYSIAIVLCVILVLVIIIFVKIVNKQENSRN